MNTLLLYSSGGARRDLILHTYFNPILDLLESSSGLVKKIRSHKFYYSIVSPYQSLSYTNDWKEAFEASKEYSITAKNILNQKKTQRFLKQNIQKFDLVIILHSAIGDNVKLIQPYKNYLLNRKGQVLSFLGNEYSLMKEKKKFLSEIEVDYIASQLPEMAFRSVYSDMNAKLIAAPHALQQKFYIPPMHKKKFDISFVGARYPLFIGDNERNTLIDYVSKETPYFNNNISIGKNKNMPRHMWKELLQNSRATVGAEAGTYFLDSEGELMEKAKSFENENPDCTLEELIQEIFEKTPIKYINGKAISSRHFEPIGTKCCQILLEGTYNGILKEDEHFIGVKKDYSNFDEVIEKYKNPRKRKEIVDSAYDHVITHHTYEKRVQSILNQIT